MNELEVSPVSSDESECDIEECVKDTHKVKESFVITTYVELHNFVRTLTEILEEVYELGILNGHKEEYSTIMTYIVNCKPKTELENQVSPDN